MIRVVCPSCNARYRLDPEKLAGRAQAKARCVKCGENIDIDNDAVPDQDLPPEAAEQALPPTAKGRAPRTAKVKSLRSDEAVDSDTVTGLNAASHLTLPEDKKYSIAVLHGQASGAIFELTGVRTTIGRSDADIVLDDAECSREHAVIEILGSEARLQDVGSTNGTFVDGNQVEKANLENRSEFRIGEHVMMFIVTDRE